MFLKYSLIFIFIEHSYYYAHAVDSLMSLESLYLEDELLVDLTSRPILPSKNCSSAFKNFTNSVVSFTSCALKNARPIHICVNCENEHYSSVQSYNKLKLDSKACQEYYFSSDQVSIVDVLYQDIVQLWSDNYCENCYLNTSLTKMFFDISNDLRNCISNSNKSEFLPANTTCVKCHDKYANISDKYSLFVKSPIDYGKVCMDVVDTMNITRQIWKDYNCMQQFDTRIGYPNIIVALAIGMTPVLFYLLAKNVSIIEDVKIVRPKRKFVASITPEPPKE